MGTELPEVAIPDVWPSDPSQRCLNGGSPEETLLERARRCATEVPEDAASLRVLGALGSDEDVPLLETFAIDGWHAEVAVEALEMLDTPRAREARVRVACVADAGGAAANSLMRDPQSDELDMYLANQGDHGRAAMWAVGTLGDARGRVALMASRDLRGLAQDPHPDAVAALEALIRPPKDAITVLRSMPADHPLYVPLLERLWNEPSLRMYLPGLVVALPDEEALPRLKRLRQACEARCLKELGRQVRREPERFAEIADRIREQGPPLAHLGMVESEPDVRDELWALVDDPEVGWDAAQRLLLVGDADRRLALARRVLASAPKEQQGVRKLAEKVVNGEPTSPLHGLLEPSTMEGILPPERVTVRDGPALLARWRDRSDGRSRHWRAAIGPWIWETPEDLRRLRGTVDLVALTAAGDAQGLALLERSPMGRRRTDLEARWLAGKDVRLGVASASTGVDILRQVQAGDVPEVERLWKVAAHPGQRWWLVAALEEHQGADAEPLLTALLAADWRYQELQERLVEAARTREVHGAVGVLAVAGEVDVLRERLAVEHSSQVWRQVLKVVTTSPAPHPSTVALVAEEIPGRELSTAELVAAWRVPGLRRVVDLDLCATVRVASAPDAQIPDDALLAAIRGCRQVPRVDEVQGARLQQALFESGDVGLAFQIHAADPEVIATFLDAPSHRADALLAFTSIEPPEQAWPQLEEALATWGEGERTEIQTLVRVFRRYRPAAALGILGARVAQANDRLVIDHLLGWNDGLEVLIPVVERGGVQAERVGKRIRGVAEPLYRQHQELIDKELAPSWEVRK